MLINFEGRPGPRNLLISALIFAMVLIGLVAFYTYRAYQAAATDLVMQRDGQLAQLSAARLLAELDNFSEILIDLARTNDIFSGEPQLQREALETASSRLAVFDGGVLLLDSQGQVIATQPARPEYLNLDLSNREYFRSLLSQSGAYISDAVADGPDRIPVIAISVPIQGPQGEFVGALVGFFQLGEEVSSSFYASLVRLRLGQTGSTYLFDGQARILFDTASDRVGHFLTTAQLTHVSELRQSGPHRTVDEAGNEIVAALAPVPRTDWTLVIEDDWRLLTRSTRRYANIFFLSLAMGLLLPPIGVGILARQRRLRQIIPDFTFDEEQMTATIQDDLKPKSLPLLPGWKVTLRTSPGDNNQQSFYDAAILNDGRLLLALGQAGPRGVEAALALTKTHAIMRAAAERHSDPKEAMTQCNRLLTASYDGEISVSCVYLILDPVNGQFHFCNAGQASPIIRHHLINDRVWHPSVSDRMGVKFEPSFEGGGGLLRPGQTLLLANRQALEARGTNGEAFIDDVLLDILFQPPESLERLASSLNSEFQAFASTLPYASPGMTLILLQRNDEDESNGNQG